ncbi:hypothetical protein BFP70_09055 [Thioclava sp. SK-1]|nr:hypothetical protein BFP70_09055 [Thioclava sp. SK-1]
MFQLVTGALGLFVALHLWPLLPASLLVRILSCICIGVISQHHFLTKLAFGTMFSAEVPRFVVIGVNVLFATLVFAAVLFLALDLLRLIVAVVRRAWIPLPLVAGWGVLGVALVLGVIGVVSAIAQPAVRRVDIPIANLAERFDGYRIVQLTDLHLSRLFQAPWATELVLRTNALAPDAILITGDLIDGTLEARARDVAPLADLQAADGVFVVSGNHEYYFNHDRWMAHYAGLGMTVLHNEHVVLGGPAAGLVLAGVPDRSAHRFGLSGPDLGAALRGAPKGLPVILLNHQPADAHLSAQAGVDLHLSGHTHGGMIRGLDALIARFNDGFVSGLYRLGDTALYVNNGTALWPGFSVRLGVPSELTVFTLVRA